MPADPAAPNSALLRASDARSPSATATTSGARRGALRKGYMLATFPAKDLPIAEQFRMLKKAGFEGVEPPSDLDHEEVLRARDESGLVIASVSCGVHSRALSDPDPAKREAGVEGVKRALRDAKAYGATSVLVVPGIVTEPITYRDAFLRVQGELRKAVPLAEELGVKMALENVWNHFLLSPLEAARFVDEFKSPGVGWHFDVGNVMYLGWPEQWIRILGKRIEKLHIKEYSRKKMNEHGLRAGFAVEYLAGDNNWPEIMKALKEVGYEGWGIAEPAWRPAGVDAATRLRQISEKLDQIFAL